VDNECQLTKSPWYLQDGDLLLFKDDREPEVEHVTESETNKNDSHKSAVPPKNRPQEKALKIWTIYDPEYQQELECERGDDKTKVERSE
jgi:pSer/pThr/pTyr-binding forkhead associated (FHA) protein